MDTKQLHDRIEEVHKAMEVAGLDPRTTSILAALQEIERLLRDAPPEIHVNGNPVR